MIGVQPDVVCNVENGVHIPDNKTRQKIEKFMCEKINWLYPEPINHKTIHISTRYEAERTFRRLVKKVCGLPEADRNEFISIAILYLRRLKRIETG